MGFDFGYKKSGASSGKIWKKLLTTKRNYGRMELHTVGVYGFCNPNIQHEYCTTVRSGCQDWFCIKLQPSRAYQISNT